MHDVAIEGKLKVDEKKRMVKLEKVSILLFKSVNEYMNRLLDVLRSQIGHT